MSTSANPQATSRRKILQWSGVTAASATLAAVGWRLAQSEAFQLAAMPAAAPQSTSVAAEPAAVVYESLAARSAFLPHVQTVFVTPTDSTMLTLVEVGPEHSQMTERGHFVSYSLVFEGPALFLNAGGLCKLTHEKMGNLEFFLSPVGMAAKGRRQFEAVFSVKV